MTVRLRKIKETDKDKYIELQRETWVAVNLLNNQSEKDVLWKGLFTENEKNYAILADDEICGFCAIKHMDGEEQEISIELYKRFQHKGIGYLALKELLTICEEEYHMKSVISKVFPDNYPSILLMRKVGAVPFGIERNMAVEEDKENEFRNNNRELLSENLSRVASLFCVENEELLSRVLVFKIKLPIMGIQFDLPLTGDLCYKKDIETRATRFIYQQMKIALKKILAAGSQDGENAIKEGIEDLLSKYDNL